MISWYVFSIRFIAFPSSPRPPRCNFTPCFLRHRLQLILPVEELIREVVISQGGDTDDRFGVGWFGQLSSWGCGIVMVMGVALVAVLWWIQEWRVRSRVKISGDCSQGSGSGESGATSQSEPDTDYPQNWKKARNGKERKEMEWKQSHLSAKSSLN